MGSRLLEQLKNEMAIINVAAVGALISTLREMVKQAVPTLAPHREGSKPAGWFTHSSAHYGSRPPCPVQGSTAEPSENAGPAEGSTGCGRCTPPSVRTPLHAVASPLVSQAALRS